MKKNILLPTDFSDNAWGAAVYALKLLADVECTFYFMHAIKLNPLTLVNLNGKLLETMREKAMKELLELKEMAETANTNPNHDFEIILSAQDLQTAIETAVKKHSIDLIVMGKKGVSAANDIFLGSNTVHIINKVRLCPILIIPEDYDFVTPKRIAFPTDFNRFYEAKELDPLKDLAELNNSKINVMHINVEERLNEVQKYNSTMLKDYLKCYEHSFHWMPDYESKTNEINDFITDLKIDVLVMLNYKHGFLESIIKEPVLKKIGMRPIIPCMIIPE